MMLRIGLLQVSRTDTAVYLQQGMIHNKVLWQLVNVYTFILESPSRSSTCGQTNFKFSASLLYIVKVQHVYLPLRNPRTNAAPNILDLRLASSSRPAVSNMMMVLRLSNSREVSIGFQGQSVRHSDDN